MPNDPYFTRTNITGRYSVNGQTTRQLFDLSKDSLEMTNLIDDPEEAKRIQALEANLKRPTCLRDARADRDHGHLLQHGPFCIGPFLSFHRP